MRSLSKLLLRRGYLGYSTNLIYHYNVVHNWGNYLTEHNDFTITENDKKRLSRSALVVVEIRIQVNHVGNINRLLLLFPALLKKEEAKPSFFYQVVVIPKEYKI